MATSKNNRKKGHKRQSMHSRPVPPTVAKAREEQQKKEIKEMTRMQKFSFLGMLLMIVGFVAAIMGHRLIGFPVSAAGTVIGLASVPEDLKHRNVSIVGYIVYLIMVVFMWVMDLTQLV